MLVHDRALREAVCEVGRRMYARHLVAGTDGNISVRLPKGRYLCTPSGVSKGFMAPEDLLIADGDGRKLGGDGKVTTEFFTHLAAYEERDDIGAVVHAHPPKAVAFTLAGLGFEEPVLPEVVYALGRVPTAAYGTPGTREGSEVIRPHIREVDAVILDRHGAVTVGTDVFDAYLKMEKLEHAAEILFAAHQLGPVKGLTAEQIDKLMVLRESYSVVGGMR